MLFYSFVLWRSQEWQTFAWITELGISSLQNWKRNKITQTYQSLGENDSTLMGIALYKKTGGDELLYSIAPLKLYKAIHFSNMGWPTLCHFSNYWEISACGLNMCVIQCFSIMWHFCLGKKWWLSHLFLIDTKTNSQF